MAGLHVKCIGIHISYLAKNIFNNYNYCMILVFAHKYYDSLQVKRSNIFY